MYFTAEFDYAVSILYR